MTGTITIRQRTFPERRLWALGGLVGVIVPVFGPLVALVALFPPLALGLLAALAVLTWRIRARADAQRVRDWAFWTWVVVTTLFAFAVIALISPPGAGLPEGAMAVAFAVVGTAAIALGSSAIAVGAYEIGRRRFWNGQGG